jgi:YbbR domain-containing protein
MRHLGLKLVSLVLASMLWLAVAGEATVYRNLRVPLEFANVPEPLEMIGEPPSSVEVRVRGSSAILGGIDPGDVVAVLDLRAAREGRRLFHILSDQVRVPFGVTVSQVSPGTIALQFERSGTRVVPVVPAIEGEPAAGYAVTGWQSNPAQVEIVGPESRLRDLTEATTEPVSGAGADTTVRVAVTVGVADSAVRLKEARTAHVTVAVTPAPVEQVVPAVAVRFRNLGSGRSAKAEPRVVDVTLRGSRDALRAIVPAAVSVLVDLAGLGAGGYNLPVRVGPLGRVGVGRPPPATVQVTIR